MSSKISEFLPEFDPVTAEQEDKISEFVAKFLPAAIRPSADDKSKEDTTTAYIPVSYEWLLKAENSASPSSSSEQTIATSSSSSSSPSLPLQSCPRRIIAYKLLVARKWDVEKAAEMLKDSVKWREENNFHTRPFFPSPIVINGFDHETLREFFKMKERPQNENLDRIIHRLRPHYWCNFHKWDRSGHPIIIECIGKIDAKNALKSLKTLVRPGDAMAQPVAEMHSFQNELANFLIRFQNWKAEAAWRAKHVVTSSSSSASTPTIPPIPIDGPFPRRITSLTAILDAKGLSMSALSSDAIEIIKTTLALDQANYPELLHRCFIVNCPSIVMFIFNIFKGSLDPRVREKIVFCSADDTRDVLLKAIDKENLPKFLGGSCECSGGCVCMTARREGEKGAGEVGGCADDDESFAHTEEVSISAGDKFVQKIKVSLNPPPPSALSTSSSSSSVSSSPPSKKIIWEWESVHKNTIEFSAVFTPDDPEAYKEAIKAQQSRLKKASKEKEREMKEGGATLSSAASSPSPSPSSLSVPSAPSSAFESDTNEELERLKAWGKLSGGGSSSPSASGPSSPSPSSSAKVRVSAPTKLVTGFGDFTAFGDGTLSVTWSNEFSMLTSKTLRYRIIQH